MTDEERVVIMELKEDVGELRGEFRAFAKRVDDGPGSLSAILAAHGEKLDRVCNKVTANAVRVAFIIAGIGLFLSVLASWVLSNIG